MKTHDEQLEGNPFSEGPLQHYLQQVSSDRFIQAIADRSGVEARLIREQIEKNYLSEISTALIYLADENLSSGRILEVGAGYGLLSAWLTLAGVNVYPLEPGGEGFENNNRVLHAVWDYFGLPTERILSLFPQDLNVRDHGQFDLIFSINVLEHVEDLTTTFRVLTDLLAPDGCAVHTCPNYSIPYEPHFGIPLVPFFPQWMGRLTQVDHTGLWRSLNFISHRQVTTMARKNGLQVRFITGQLYNALQRTLTDSIFQERHATIAKVVRLLKWTGLLFLIRHLPAQLSTPMTFRLKRRGNLDLTSNASL